MFFFCGTIMESFVKNLGRSMYIQSHNFWSDFFFFFLHLVTNLNKLGNFFLVLGNDCWFVGSWGSSTYCLTIFRVIFGHLAANLQESRNFFYQFWCVLAYKYFGDMDSRQFICETINEPSIWSLTILERSLGF